MTKPQKFTNSDATGYYLYHLHDGLDSQKLKRFYIELRDTLLGQFPLSVCAWRLMEDVGIRHETSRPCSYEIYKTESGIAFVELKGDLGTRNHDTNQLFDNHSSRRRDLELLTVQLIPPTPCLEKSIEKRLAEYGSTFELKN
jgi:hypothetical protein